MSLPRQLPPPPRALPRPAGSPPGPAESPDLFDYALLRNWSGFILRAVRRHEAFAVACFLATASLGLLSLVLLPRTYRVQTRILAQRNAVMSTLSNPYLPRPWDFDAPTRAARETVLRRDNLLALIDQTDLVRRYVDKRAPAIWLRDTVMRVFGRVGKDEFIDGLVDRLEKKLAVEVGDGVVTLTFDWSDGETAYRVVEAAVQNFLEVRHASEIAIMSDAIAILESHAASVEQEIAATVRQVSTANRSQQQSRAAAVRAAVPAAHPAPARERGGRDEDLARLQAQLVAKRRAIVDLEEFRQRRLAELQGQLTQYESIYTDRHPAVLAVRQNIDAIAGPSPQIEALRAEAAELERGIVMRGGSVQGHSRESAGAAPRDRGEISAIPRVLVDDDPQLEYERGQLRLLFNKYNALRERIDGARVELDTAQAAFKYRYSVITPPQMPRRPLKPNSLVVLAASVLGGVFFALFAAALLDLRSGRLLEGWQLERRTGLRVLAEIRQ